MVGAALKKGRACMNIYFTSHDLRYRALYSDYADKIKKEFPNSRFVILYSCPQGSEIPAPYERFLLPIGFKSKLECAHKKEDELCARLLRFADRVPMDLFRSDMRLVLGERDAEMIVAEQAELLEAIDRQFTDMPPDIFFASSGTNIVHSVGYYLAVAAGARAFRIHSYLNLNLNHSGHRVWFCESNCMQLSDKRDAKFSYSNDDVTDHVETILTAIRERVFKIDEISKSYRRRRMPLSPRDFINDIVRFIGFSTFLGWRSRLLRLKATPHLRRLRVVINAWRNQRITLSLSELPKPFILFALNTPYDSQILVRAPEYRDFLGLIELVAGMIPYGYDLVIREHPAFLGMLEHKRMVALQRRHPHVKIVSSDESFSEVVAKTEGVLIINNTAFVDSILLGKPVISLGNGYFQGRGLTREVAQLQDLRVAFGELLRGELDGDRSEALSAAMSELLKETWPGPNVVCNDKVLVVLEGMIEKLRRVREVKGDVKSAVCLHVSAEDAI